MLRRGSKRAWRKRGYLAILACACLAAAPLQAQTSTRVSPRSDEIFSPRTYGSARAPYNVVMMISPGNALDEKLYLDLYPRIQPLVSAGKARLEIRLWSHMQTGLPIYIVAQCLDPSVMPLYLYEAFSAEHERYESNMDLEELLVQQALRDPQLTGDSLTPDELHRRLNWCLTKRRDAMIDSEASRFQSIYDWGLKNSGVLQPAVVVNQKVFDGNVDVQDVMKSLNEDN